MIFQPLCFWLFQDGVTFDITYVEVDNRADTPLDPTLVSGGPGHNSVQISIPSGSGRDNTVKVFGFRTRENK